MHNVTFILLSSIILFCTAFALFAIFPQDIDMSFTRSIIPVLLASLVPTSSAQNDTKVDLGWYPPKKSWINDLGSILNGTGTNGFVFDGSQLPDGVPYGTYSWCNMPHVRKEEYVRASDEYELVYVEVIHRHHKRTPYASNTFPRESYRWDCADQGLSSYGQPLNPSGNASAKAYWSVYTNPTNPFSQLGFNGSCQFPQITRQGLDDSWQHGKDLYGVYHDVLHFLPDDLSDSVSYRVTNNVITSQVAGMVINGMYNTTANTPLLIQPPTIDSLEPQYSCPAATTLYSSYGVGSISPSWTSHLTSSAPLFATLDAISGISPTSIDWHKSLDHYYDNLSARQCHGKSLPCNVSNSTFCVTQADADTVYRLGQYEYSYLYRDSPESLRAAVGSYGVWLAELAVNIRDAISSASSPISPVLYRHNVAHDGSLARLLGVLQVEQMVWVGMGSEVVFEIYRNEGDDEGKRYIRILWGGQVLRSSSPELRSVDMLDVEVFLGYIEGLVGKQAKKVVDSCES